MAKGSGHKRRPGRNTRIVEAGRRKDWTRGLVSPPVHRASTILFDTYAEMRDGVAHMYNQLFYGRFGTPTQWALAEAVCEAEGGAGARLYPSGMAAISAALLSALKSGDHLLMSDSVYEPTRKFSGGLLRRMGVETDFYDPLVGADIAGLFRENTRCVFVESPGSLTMEIQDLPAIAGAAHERNALVIADNTWATPHYFAALEKGADIVVHSATKYIAGHSDIMLGVAVANEKAWKRLQLTSQTLGQTASPDDAWLGLRGYRTLSVRLAAHQENALTVAKWLDGHPLVDRVLHPNFPACPGHEIFERDFTGASGLFSFVLKGGKLADIGAMVDDMDHFSMGFSWGGFESLILPADPTSIRTAVPWQVPGPLIRLHVGLEDVDDLIADLDAGLTRFGKTIAK